MNKNGICTAVPLGSLVRFWVVDAFHGWNRQIQLHSPWERRINRRGIMLHQTVTASFEFCPLTDNFVQPVCLSDSSGWMIPSSRVSSRDHLACYMCVREYIVYTLNQPISQLSLLWPKVKNPAYDRKGRWCYAQPFHLFLSLYTVTWLRTVALGSRRCAKTIGIWKSCFS